MLKNYLKVSLRNFIRHTTYSLINIAGLSIGITCCILILAFLGYEFSFDRYHEHADDIYRILSETTINGAVNESASCPMRYAPTLVNDFPEVVNAARINPTVKRSFIYEDKQFFESNVFYADHSIFDVFSFELIEGDPETALEAPFTMVITEKTAYKYFGDESPVGKIMNWDNKFDYAITGVVKDPPPNSHFSFTVLASFTTYFTYDPRLAEYWWGWNIPTYIRLEEGTDYRLFEKKFEQFNQQYLREVLEERGIILKNNLEPLTRIHLYSTVGGGLGEPGNSKVIYALISIAVIILIIACVNFINLTTARFTNRAKEVGLRKVVGAKRSNLIVQFLSESAVYGFLSLVIAVICAQLILPQFNNLTDRNIALDYIQLPWLTISLAVILLFVTAITGIYPSLFLSAFNPVSVLKSKVIQSSGSTLFRSALVVFQFTISIFLIIFTLIIQAQHSYMQNKDLGFTKNNILAIALQNDLIRLSLESFKDELLKMNGVISTGASSMVPGEMYLFNANVYPEGFTKDQTVNMQNFLVDYGYFNVLDIEIVKGREFLRDFTADHENGIIINETVANTYNWDNPIGKKLNIVYSLENNQSSTSQMEIIGVCKDFHNRSLYSEISPVFINYIGSEGSISNRPRRLIVKMNGIDIPQTLELIEKKWEEFYPDMPYYSFFLDEFYNNHHRNEERLSRIFIVFALLAIIVACLGLFGLAAYTTEQRTREIGIRKVVGSTARAVIILLSRNYLRLIGISNLIAWPIAFLVTRNWLENYPYRTDLTLFHFILASLVTLLLALLTVFYHSGKAALINPAQTLKYE